VRRTCSATSSGAASPAIRRRTLRHGQRISLDLEIGRGNPSTTIDQCELERLALGKSGQACLLDGRNMNENVLTAIVTDNEAESLLAVEEFDDALALADDLGRHARTAEATATTAAAAATAESTAATAAVAATATAIAITTTGVTTAETVAAAEAAILISAVVLFAETVALVSAAPAALAATPSVKTHALVNFQAPKILSEPPRWAERANGLGAKNGAPSFPIDQKAGICERFCRATASLRFEGLVRAVPIVHGARQITRRRHYP